MFINTPALSKLIYFEEIRQPTDA